MESKRGAQWIDKGDLVGGGGKVRNGRGCPNHKRVPHPFHYYQGSMSAGVIAGILKDETIFLHKGKRGKIRVHMSHP
jgi:hypothetical protein